MAARLPLASVVSVLAAFGLAGCGGSSDPLTAVSDAAKTSLASAFVADLTLTGADALGAKPAQQLLGKGVFDARRGLAYERVDLPGPLEANKLPARDYLVFVPKRILLAPAAQTALPAGKRVISAELTGPGATLAGVTRFVAAAMGLNPQLLLDEIVWGGTAASKTGSEVVSHVPFTDYRVTVDLRRALSRATGPFARAERMAIRRELAALGPGRPVVRVDVRTDGAGFVRGLKTTVPGTRLGALSMDLHGYGSTFKPNLPAASDIVPLDTLTESGAWTPQSPWIFGAA